MIVLFDVINGMGEICKIFLLFILRNIVYLQP